MTPSNQPLISVLLTAWNEERFLPMALDSLLAQSYPNFEAVIVNDGSTDGTSRILDTYAARDNRIRPVYQEKRGRSAGLNLAVQSARGDFLAIMDSDDVSLPHRLEKELSFLQLHPSVGMVASYYEQIGPDHRVIKRVESLPVDPQLIGKRLEEDNPVCHGTVMLRRAVMEKAGGYREAFRAALDYDLYLRVLDQADIAVIPEVLYQYRVHGGSISSNRLVQLQMKSMAQALRKERLTKGRDSLQQTGNLAEQQKRVADFLARDLRENRKIYSRALFESGRRYYELGETEAALHIFTTALRLDPTRFRTLRYLGRTCLKRLLG